MKLVKSTGFVTFIKQDNGYKVVLLDHGKHISHPKGRMKDEETKLETALRELEEETSLKLVRHSSKPVHKHSYKIKKRSRTIRKKVFLYAGITESDRIRISDEHRRYLVLVPSHAMDTLTYKGDKKALQAALEWLVTIDPEYDSSSDFFD